MGKYTYGYGCNIFKMHYLLKYIGLYLVLGIYITPLATGQCDDGFKLYEINMKSIYMCCRIVDCPAGYTAQQCDVDKGNQTCVRETKLTTESKTEDFPTTSRAQTPEYTTTKAPDFTNEVSTNQTTVEIAITINTTNSSERVNRDGTLMSTLEPPPQRLNDTTSQKPDVSYISSANRKTTRQLPILVVFLACISLLCR